MTHLPSSRRPGHPVRRGLGRAVIAGLLLAPSLGLAAGPARAVPSGGTTEPPGVADAGIGAWEVRPLEAGRWQVTWTAPTPLPLSADRPTIESLSGAVDPEQPPVIAPGTSEVSAVVTADLPPDPADLDVVLSGTALDESGSTDAPPDEDDTFVPPERELLPADPAEEGALEVVSEDYRLPGLTAPGYDAPVEVEGHVVRPAVADDSHPLVLFLHGRHTYCYSPASGQTTYRWPCRTARGQRPVPSHLGYDYLQRRLAGQGFVTVSISANGINAQDWADDDGGAATRARLVRTHLDQWAAWVADGTHRADLDQVVLVGHSRGGEGVSRASLETPLGASYRIAGQVLLAPTNFALHTTPFVPTVTVLPSCDGDVFDLQGQSYTDLARGLADGDTSLRSSVMVLGANHNYFNTEWTPGIAAAPADDDWGQDGGFCGTDTASRLTAAEQRSVGTAYVTAAVRLFARGERVGLPLLDGTPARVTSTGSAVALSHAVGGGRDLRVPGVDGTAVGEGAFVCRGVTPGTSKAGMCGRDVRDPAATPHWPDSRALVLSRPALELGWSTPGQAAGLELDEPWDLSGADRLALRTVVDPVRGAVRTRVRLTDDAGATVTVAPAGGGRVPALPPAGGTPRLWAETLLVDLASATGIDVGRVRRVELVGDSGDGRVWVLDLAAVPDALPSIPARRVPVIDLGRARVDEGDDPAATVSVPFEVVGDVTAPGRLRLYGVDGGTGRRAGLAEATFDVSGTGVARWPLDADTLDDDDRRTVLLLGHGLRNAVVRGTPGRLVVSDDDPTPRVSVRAVRTRVAEGRPIRWRVRLGAAVGYPVTVTLRPAAPPRGRTGVRVDDLDPRWVRRHVWNGRPGTPFARAGVDYSVRLAPGVRTVDVVLPLRADGRREGAETAAVTLRARGQVAFSVRRVVTVVDR